jgi:putative transposase
MEIIALLQCLCPTLTVTTVRQLSRIICALLAMSGRVTMLGLSRWAGEGGSYRTVQRWFYTVIPWIQVFVQFFRQHLFCPADVYILAGDEVVVTKAGKHTFGLDRFFSSLLQRPVPSLAFFALSLVSTRERSAFPLSVEQVIRTEAEKAARKAQTEAKQAPTPERKPGRPKGSKNRNKAEVSLTPELQHIQAMIQALLHLLTGWLSLTYLALDGHFGNHNALQMTRQCGLHLISKLRSDSALYFPYAGPQAKRGPHRKYGEKVDYRELPASALKQTTVKDGIETRVYQAMLLHKEFTQPLNVVLIVKTNLHTQDWAHVLLFSSDLNLAWDKLIDYYSLRFQIEFNFRDAKQYWGLEDFMNITETAVINAASLSLFMVGVSECLRRRLRPDDTEFSVLDLKAYYRGSKYVTETIKMLQEKPDPNLISAIFRQVAALGSIHPSPAPAAAL